MISQRSLSLYDVDIMDLNSSDARFYFGHVQPFCETEKVTPISAGCIWGWIWKLPRSGTPNSWFEASEQYMVECGPLALRGNFGFALPVWFKKFHYIWFDPLRKFNATWLCLFSIENWISAMISLCSCQSILVNFLLCAHQNAWLISLLSRQEHVLENQCCEDFEFAECWSCGDVGFLYLTRRIGQPCGYRYTSPFSL